MNGAHAMLLTFMSGAMVMGYAVAAIFFLRFWRDTRDRLFLSFGAAFLLFALQRVLLAFSGAADEDRAYLYVIRLLGFLIILAAIVQKNRVPRGGSGA